MSKFCFVNRLLVGAPRAVALPLQRANRTGGLYECDITSEGPCTRIEFDNNGVFFTQCSPDHLACTLLALTTKKEKGVHAVIFGERASLIASALTVSCLPEDICFLSHLGMHFPAVHPSQPRLLSQLRPCVDVAT